MSDDGALRVQLWETTTWQREPAALLPGGDGRNQIIEAESHRPVQTLAGIDGAVISLAYLPDGSRLFAATDTGRLELRTLRSRTRDVE